MFEWSFEWDCRLQISLPTGMSGKLKTPSSCIVGSPWVPGYFKIHVIILLQYNTYMYNFKTFRFMFEKLP